MPSDVIGIVIAIALAVIGWLEWRRMTREERIAYIEELTQQAEQLWKTQKIGDRLQYVTERLEKRYPWLKGEDLRGAIEAAVFRLNRSLPVIIDAAISRNDAARGTYWDGSGRQN